MPPAPDHLEDDTQWRTAGDRIQTLLDASSSAGATARARAEQLVREVTDLYGAALQRILRICQETGTGVEDRLIADDLVASMLVVHGLHPHSVQRRVADALDTVRPYLGSHGGDIELLEIAGDPDNPVVRLRFDGSCKSCPSSAVTLELAVEDALRAAAPEISSIEVVAAAPAAELIPAQALFRRLHTDGSHSTPWTPVPELADLDPGGVGGFLVAGSAVLAARVGDEFYAYRDRCPACTVSMAGAVLRHHELACPRCGSRYDVVRAGVGLDGAGRLEPVPLLTRDGVPAMAVAIEERAEMA
ncbi:NifU family protein [Mycolicibacterium sp. XJ1819]